jgi:hypothetical protein
LLYEDKTHREKNKTEKVSMEERSQEKADGLNWQSGKISMKRTQHCREKKMSPGDDGGEGEGSSQGQGQESAWWVHREEEAVNELQKGNRARGRIAQSF